MNKAKLTSMCHKIAKDTGLMFNTVMTYYFLELILKQLSQSNYAKNYIFKGGLLLANIIGVESRSTVDIDFLFDKVTLSENEVRKQLTEILSPTDNVFFNIESITTIKDSDDYGGYRVNIICRLENIEQRVHLDIATGDVVTPDSIVYKYKAIFVDDVFPIIAYNIETIIAEKLQTIYSLNFLNTRSKDFYDVYILLKLRSDEINLINLFDACQKTFAQRKTELDIAAFVSLIEAFKNDDIKDAQWQNYARKHSYTSGIQFIEVLDSIDGLLRELAEV